MSVEQLRPAAPIEIAHRPPSTTMSGLRGGLDHFQISMITNAKDGHEFYDIMMRNVYPHVFSDDTIAVIGPPVTGMQLQHLFLRAAPSKLFGNDEFDYADTQRDWTNLYQNVEESKRLLLAHQSIPGWDLFEEHREWILKFIKNDHDGHADPQMDYIRPVIHLTSEGFGLNDFDPETAQTLGLMPGEGVPYLGPLLVASLSPEVTNSWPMEANFSLQRNGKTNDMGATQVLPLTVALQETLLKTSYLIKNIRRYCVTGELPEPRRPRQNVIINSQPPKPLTICEVAQHTSLVYYSSPKPGNHWDPEEDF